MPDARRQIRTWVVLALAGLACLPWLNIPVDNADSAGMLAHLQGMFRDLDLLYDYAQLRVLPIYAFVTDTGVVSNHWPIGATFLQAPGYLAGRFGATLVGHEGWTLPVLGVRTWALVWLCVAMVTVVRWFGGRTGVVAALAFGLGTPLVYYAAEAPLRPHLWGALVVLAIVGRHASTDVAPLGS